MAVNTLYDALVAHHRKDAVFIETPDNQPLTYGALDEAISTAIGHLQDAGVAPGDRVLCQAEKSPMGLVLYLATVAAGGVYVPLNTAYTAAEISYFLDDAEPALFIHDTTTIAAADIATAKGIAVRNVDALAAGGRSASPSPRGPNDLAGILYTSGTTGRSKGAMLTHNNLVSNAKALAAHWQFSAQDCLLHALPIFHTHGLFVATNVTLCVGSRMLMLPAFDLDAIVACLPRATTMMGVPTFYTRMLGDPRFTKEFLAHMRLIISGSAPLLAETHAAFEARLGHAILERYGMTETNMITSNPYNGPRRAGTVGQPLPGVQLRIANPDEQGIGGVELIGQNVTPGYWQNAEKTAESFASDGWFKTGDLGKIDATGYLSIVGREKDLVISGGFNIYPKEVEVEIDDLPGVLESAVYGVPHPDLGEAVAAAIVLSQDADPDEMAILNALKDRLARYKIPRQIRFVPELPRNTMGKVQKTELRREAVATENA